MYVGNNLKKIGAFEAKNRLSELLDAAENGEEVIITKHGRPVAKLVPVDEIDRARVRESIEWFKDFRKKHPLRGLKIKDLINEGRKY
jgi:prevent-host-death family protein